MATTFLGISYGQWSVITATLVMAASLAVSVAMLYDFTTASGGIRSNERIPLITQHLELLLTQAETGQRGFIITGDERYLDVYQRGIDGFQPVYAELVAQAAHNNPHINEPVSDMGRVATAKMLELADVIRDRREASWERAVAKVDTHVGKNLMDNFRKDINEVDVIAGKDVAAYDQKATRAAEWAAGSLVINVASIIALILLLSSRAKADAKHVAPAHWHDPNEESLRLNMEPPANSDGRL